MLAVQGLPGAPFLCPSPQKTRDIMPGQGKATGLGVQWSSWEWWDAVSIVGKIGPDHCAPSYKKFTKQ